MSSLRDDEACWSAVLVAAAERLAEQVGRIVPSDLEAVLDIVAGLSVADVPTVVTRTEQATDRWLRAHLFVAPPCNDPESSAGLIQRELRHAARIVLIELTSPYRSADVDAASVEAPPVASEPEQLGNGFAEARLRGTHAAWRWVVDHVAERGPVVRPRPDDVAQRFARAMYPLIRRQIVAMTRLPSKVVEDRVQDVWADLLSETGLGRWDVHRGKGVPGYVRMLVKRRLYRYWRRGNTLKRGGESSTVQFEDTRTEHAADSTPEDGLIGLLDLRAAFARMTDWERAVSADLIRGVPVAEIVRNRGLNRSQARSAYDLGRRLRGFGLGT